MEPGSRSAFETHTVTRDLPPVSVPIAKAAIFVATPCAEPLELPQGCALRLYALYMRPPRALSADHLASGGRQGVSALQAVQVLRLRIQAQESQFVLPRSTAPCHIVSQTSIVDCITHLVA